MSNVVTEIKGTIMSHLRGGLFGKNIYGQHEHTIFDGKQNRTLIIEVVGANRFARYGVVTVYHPTFGKWQASLLSAHHCGKPVQVMTTEQIQESIRTTPSHDFIYKVYGGELPNMEQVRQEREQAIANALWGAPC